MADMILEMLKIMDRKIDGIKSDIADMKVKDAEIVHRLDRLEEKYGYVSAKNNDISQKLKTIEKESVRKDDIDALYGKIRNLEQAPQVKLTEKISFVKKAILSGVALLITGAVVFLGRFMWLVVTNMATISEIIEKIK